MGRTIQGHQVPQKRHLSPGEVGRDYTTSPLERRASEKVLPVRQHLYVFLCSYDSKFPLYLFFQINWWNAKSFKHNHSVPCSPKIAHVPKHVYKRTCMNDLSHLNKTTSAKCMDDLSHLNKTTSAKCMKDLNHLSKTTSAKSINDLNHLNKTTSVRFIHLNKTTSANVPKHVYKRTCMDDFKHLNKQVWHIPKQVH